MFSRDIKYMRSLSRVHIKKITQIDLEDNLMKKIVALLAMSLMIVGLAGCMDDPDGSKQKVSSSIEL